MSSQKTLTLPPLPQDSMAALEKAAAQQGQWRVLSSSKDDQPRFVIEKRVRYEIMRGGGMQGQYQIIGRFRKGKSGETILSYSVTGDGGVPLFHAGVHIGVLLVFTFLVALIAFDPSMGGNWIGFALVGVLVLITLVYARYAYRSHQGHLRELQRFMEDFAQQMGATTDVEVISPA